MDLIELINNIKNESNKKIIKSIITKEFCNELSKINEGCEVLPEVKNIFRCFDYFDIMKTKVVLLGQDPYPNNTDACGLAFSVERSFNLPKSLVNMFKELKNDLNIERINGNLEDWTKQGVLLINSALTFVKDEVKQKQAIKLWKCAIKSILKIISENNKVIFLLLGKKAEDVCEEINAYKIITSHPSPLGYTKGFRNSRIFSKINSKLRENGDKEIIWN